MRKAKENIYNLNLLVKLAGNDATILSWIYGIINAQLNVIKVIYCT